MQKEQPHLIKILLTNSDSNSTKINNKKINNNTNNKKMGPVSNSSNPSNNNANASDETTVIVIDIPNQKKSTQHCKPLQRTQIQGTSQGYH